MNLEDQIRIKLYRSFGGTEAKTSAGIIVKVWAQPAVEDFIRLVGTGELNSTLVFGRYWEPLPPMTDLQVYRWNQDVHTQALSGVISEGNTFYRLDRPGNLLIETDTNPYSGVPRNIVNLSFLRLAGISNEQGVGFKLRGVHASDTVKNMRDQIGTAVRSFISMFLKPISLKIVVSTEPGDVICR